MTDAAGLSPIGASTLAASTIGTGLPRSGALTDALLAATTTPAGALTDAVSRARTRLERGLAEISARAEEGQRSPERAPSAGPLLLRIGQYQVAHAIQWSLPAPRTGPAADAGPPFRWTSRAARRSIGLAAIRAGLDGRAATPGEAVAMVMADPSGPAGVGRTGPGSAADWIASLAAPARSLVAAEAAAWATRVWTALDWGRLPPLRLVVGGPDRWWRWSSDPPATCKVAVRGRADVRIEAAPGSDGSPGAHLAVLDGQPGVATRRALLLSALVDALASRRDRDVPSPVPARAVGWWPDCGKCWVVPVDACTLLAAADAVVSTAHVLLGNGGGGAGTVRD